MTWVIALTRMPGGVVVEGRKASAVVREPYADCDGHEEMPQAWAHRSSASGAHLQGNRAEIRLLLHPMPGFMDLHTAT